MHSCGKGAAAPASATVAIGNKAVANGSAEAVSELERLQESPQDDLAAANKLALQALSTLTKNDFKSLASMRKPPCGK
jgi:hypothetical protein